jgi:hypothetical protein
MLRRGGEAGRRIRIKRLTCRNYNNTDGVYFCVLCMQFLYREGD